MSETPTKHTDHEHGHAEVPGQAGHAHPHGDNHHKASGAAEHHTHEHGHPEDPEHADHQHPHVHEHGSEHHNKA
ncbi:zinc/manganese transport system substrate-binding protein/zinc transport system ATP-binding protein [Modestobacter sp. DSM 44400]|uniref:hypothetical protein n=1 Tax=Modestobacter sp. DSM 44400 TaxID=1550230 RepID=UPI000895351D|nr:hypothetical protein [Modestobacter sp. DSM 44400]SDY71261.1 zinc/manganese transport system substrate-binding protein/zinc transport system ATP-binding protein [Modestobacter sp. DSM 44400]